MRKAAIVGTYLKIHLSANRNSIEGGPDLEEVLEILPHEVDTGNEKATNSSQSISVSSQRLSQSNVRTSEPLEDDHFEGSNAETEIESSSMMAIQSSLNILKDTLNESLKGISQKFEDMECNETHFRKAIETNREQCKETEKCMKEAMKLQHRETRRRLERLEKKTNSGYFN